MSRLRHEDCSADKSEATEGESRVAFFRIANAILRLHCHFVSYSPKKSAKPTLISGVRDG